MRSHRENRNNADVDLAHAIGLLWGHLNTRQFDRAIKFARGCLHVWPDEKRLLMMEAYALVEMLEPLDGKLKAVLMDDECQEWGQLVLQRAETYAEAAHGTRAG